MIGTILAGGFENTSVVPVLTVWTKAYSTRGWPVSSRLKRAKPCGNTRSDRLLLAVESDWMAFSCHRITRKKLPDKKSNGISSNQSQQVLVLFG